MIILRFEVFLVISDLGLLVVSQLEVYSVLDGVNLVLNCFEEFLPIEDEFVYALADDEFEPVQCFLHEFEVDDMDVD